MPKREIILQAALALFIEQGYERTSLKQIVARTGGSLATVYKLFGSKTALFFEAIKHQHLRRMQALAAVLEEHKNLPLGKLLELFGRDYLRFLWDEENISIMRLIITRIYVDAQLAEKINQQHAHPAETYLQRVFSERLADKEPGQNFGKNAGFSEIGIAQNCSQQRAKELAQMFLGLLKSAEFAEVLWLDRRPTNEQINAHVSRICEFFMRALEAEIAEK